MNLRMRGPCSPRTCSARRRSSYRARMGADQPGEPAYGTARAVVVNSGNANAATGEPGLRPRGTARIAGDAVGCPHPRCWWRPRASSACSCPWRRSGSACLRRQSLLSAARRRGCGARYHDHRHASEGRPPSRSRATESATTVLHVHGGRYVRRGSGRSCRTWPR